MLVVGADQRELSPSHLHHNLAQPSCLRRPASHSRHEGSKVRKTQAGAKRTTPRLLTAGRSATSQRESIGEPDMKVFTTGQVAKICKVAPRTVSKWFDS